uniref:Uncharacterized protein n=1 Tax=Arundo donax TaxID=35708 RepID=A0A0A9DJ93_ARUDO
MTTACAGRKTWLVRPAPWTARSTSHEFTIIANLFRLPPASDTITSNPSALDMAATRRRFRSFLVPRLDMISILGFFPGCSPRINGLSLLRPYEWRKNLVKSSIEYPLGFLVGCRRRMRSLSLTRPIITCSKQWTSLLESKSIMS